MLAKEVFIYITKINDLVVEKLAAALIINPTNFLSLYFYLMQSVRNYLVVLVRTLTDPELLDSLKDSLSTYSVGAVALLPPQRYLLPFQVYRMCLIYGV